MINKFEITSSEYNLFSSDDYILACVSGGADSMAMLNIFLNFKENKKIKKLFCCHVNHLLRGTESFNDEKYVEDFCKKNDISFYLLQQDINKLAKQTKTSTELCARNVRYDFFNKCVKEIALIEKIDKEKIKIATAHNLNDNIETVIFNFARGTSLKGLCGIPPKRGNIIRPLINCTRNEIENYCIENNLEFVIDSTNSEIDYSRNKIRHCISPVIFQLNNSFDKTFKNNLKNFNDENDFMNQTSKNAYDDIIENERINFIKLENFHIAIKKRVIILYLQNNQIKYDNKKIDIILKNSNEKENTIELEKNTFFIKQQNFGYILKKNFPVIEKKENIKYKKIKLKNIKTYENYNFHNKNFVFQIGSQSQLKQLEKDINKKLNIFCKKVLYIDLKYDKIFGDIVLRSRQQGDKITLQKRNVTKSLKKLFNEMKISKEEREKSIIICDQEKILAVVLKDIIISSNICSFQKETDKVLKLIIY